MLGGGERRQGQRDETGIVREGVEHADQGVPLVGLGLPVAADDQRRRGPETAHDVLEPLDGDLRAVEVLEDEDERFSAGDPGERPRQQLEDLDAILGLPLFGGGRDPRVAADGRAQVGDLGELGKQRDQVAREVREVDRYGSRGHGLARSEVILDQLAEALVGEGPILLDEAAAQDTDLSRDREVLQLLEEPGLADPRLARHDRELAVPRDGGVQPSLQLGELLLAPDERGHRGALEGPARRDYDRHSELVRRETRLVSAQRLGDLSGLLGALGGILLEAPQDEVL